MEFDSQTGYLPAGVHQMTLSEVGNAFAWNPRRRLLFSGFVRAVRQLAGAGCRAIVLDGSYVTNKENPGDWDAAFDPTGVNPALIDEVLLRHRDGRKAMKAKYLGELFPWSWTASNSTGEQFREFFSRDRQGLPKGMVQISLQVVQ